MSRAIDEIRELQLKYPWIQISHNLLVVTISITQCLTTQTLIDSL